MRTTIIGTGSYVPECIQKNQDFAQATFYLKDETAIGMSADETAQKFEAITGIRERRYVRENQSTSEIGFIAAELAIKDSGIDAETLDQIIFAHNFGDVKKGTIQSDAVPSLATRIKSLLKIRNPRCVAYDLLFGCPGWIQGVIHSDAFFKSGMAKRTLVVGAETLSRVVDDYDRDSMIFSDGAGASVLEYKNGGGGILSSAALTHAVDEAYYIYMGKSYKPDADNRIKYIKMNGRKVYEYALSKVPQAMAECLRSAGKSIDDLKKIFIHQANEKLDLAVVQRLYSLYGKSTYDASVIPMNVHDYGNSSVATVPTLYDRVLRGKMEGHTLSKDDIVLFASVGAGMNINAICYQV